MYVVINNTFSYNKSENYTMQWSANDYFLYIFQKFFVIKTF